MTAAMYDQLLAEDLSTWRTPTTTMELLQTLGLLFLLATLVLYGVAWVPYLEQKYFGPKNKKRARNSKKTRATDAARDEELACLKPSLYDTLPFLVVRVVKQAPRVVGYVMEVWEESGDMTEKEENDRMWMVYMEQEERKRMMYRKQEDVRRMLYNNYEERRRMLYRKE